MRYTALFVVLCLCLCACRKPQDTQKDKTAAPIGTVTITEQDIQSALELLGDKDRKFADTTLGRQNLLQILTREKLILQDAATQNLAQDKTYQNLLAQHQAQLDKAQQAYAQDMLMELWYEKQAKKLEPTEKEIKQYYDKYPYEMTIKQIIVDNAQTADQVLRTLKGAPGRWKEMARQYSVAPSTLQTLTFMPGEYLESLEIIAANSPSGKAQGFFKTTQGFHIIMKTNEKQLSFKEAEPRIRQILQNQKLDELLDTLKTKYEVIIYDKNE
ncbi:MAG: peptidylprolyl isomerase [Elusimicrobiaceae bacterium]|nr:peptidylprolyl isomerase [Elusimicrobiaceae bacterium]